MSESEDTGFVTAAAVLTFALAVVAAFVSALGGDYRFTAAFMIIAIVAGIEVWYWTDVPGLAHGSGR